MREVISASRRTDIPAFYFDWLSGCLRQGYAETANPYSGRTIRVELAPERVHTLVLWSKNFGPLLRNAAILAPYRLYFLFTVNDQPDIEPFTPPLPERLDQVRELAARFGPERIGWRFDPVVFRESGPSMTADDFRRIGESMTASGVRRVVFSFLDLYGKVKTRNTRRGLGIVDPPEPVKRGYAAGLAAAAADMGLSLESCCEDLAGIAGITPSACIDGVLLSRLAREPAKTVKDPGQRSSCRCTASRDIGSYREMPCPHGCVYCYANPCFPAEEGKCA